MTDLSSLASRLEKKAKNLEKNTEQKLRLFTTRVVESLVFNLAIDTGRARSNYIVSLNAPTSQWLPESHVIGTKGSTASEVNVTTLNIAMDTLSEVKYTTPIFINNNLGYISMLVGRPGYDINMFIQQHLYIFRESWL